MRKTAFLTLAILLCACSAGIEDFNYDRLNRQARKEYLKPVRPGYEGRNGFWNINAEKFIFAPAFDFKEEPGASAYRFIVYSGDREFEFKADKPYTSLAPVWDEIPVGQTYLSVLALDGNGDAIREVGNRSFIRDFPFNGPYPPAARSYKECAKRALLFIHNIPAIKHWSEYGEPDMTYLLNTYPCKNVSGTICCELMLSRFVPSCADEARDIALKAGEWLMKVSRPEGDPLAFFPPTYYMDTYASGNEENQGQTMSMEACKASLAFLDLFDATGDPCFMNHVRGILETYRRLQAEDGSFPMKLNYTTGEAYNQVCARPIPLLNLIRRMDKQYDMRDWEEMRVKCENWMDEFAIAPFDMTGQFEDVSVEGVELFSNMTHWTCVPYAIYMMESGSITPEQLETCKDIIDFGEDQFAYWDSFPNDDGIHVRETPSVGEQYYYRVPIDDSAGSMAIAWMDWYLVTGDRLALAKAKAMVDSITRVQSPVTGMLPTAWESSWGCYDNDHDLIWISCNLGTILAVLKYDQLVSAAAARSGKAGTVQSDVPSIDYWMRQMMY